MKFIKQLSQDEFVVKLGLEDADNTRKIVLAHDYLQITGIVLICMVLKLLGLLEM